MSTPTKKQPINTRIRGFEALMPPGEIRSSIPLSEEHIDRVLAHRDAIEKIINGEDDRLLLIIGPCSIHDTEAGLDYARRLKVLSDQISDRFLVVMRVYFEKPRTTVGWKGLINDPHIDGSNDIREGLQRARRFLIEITEIGLPTGTEFLDPIVPQFIADIVCWAAVGARTTESQTHREMASGLSMPVGFKNATDGGLAAAMNAAVSSRAQHSFLGIDAKGATCIVNTTGNQFVHIILRGGGGKTNYSPEDVALATTQLEAQHAPSRSIMIDCSHGNSNKDFNRQPEVFNAVIDQVCGGTSAINGLMVESNIEEGNQKPDAEPRAYGTSITDACIGWDTTETLLLASAERLRS